MNDQLTGGNSFNFSPSNADLILKCQKSAQFFQGTHNENKLSSSPKYDAAMGQLAHICASRELCKVFGLAPPPPSDADDLSFGEDMKSQARRYCDFVRSYFEADLKSGSNPMVYVEKQVDFSFFAGVPATGRADCIIISDGKLHVIDYKYGQGNLVFAKKNAQMLCYGLGALGELEQNREKPIKNIQLSIFQPRRNNVSTWSLSIDELLEWADSVLAPAAKAAYEGTGNFNPGDHCARCPGRTTCRAHLVKMLSCLQQAVTGDSDTLTNDEIARIIVIPELSQWFTDLKLWAVEQAKRGVQYPGLQLITQETGARRFVNPDAVAQILRGAGVNPYKQVLISPASAERALSPFRFSELLPSVYIRRAKKSTLVPCDDTQLTDSAGSCA